MVCSIECTVCTWACVQVPDPYCMHHTCEFQHVPSCTPVYTWSTLVRMQCMWAVISRHVRMMRVCHSTNTVATFHVCSICIAMIEQSMIHTYRSQSRLRYRRHTHSLIHGCSALITLLTCDFIMLTLMNEKCMLLCIHILRRCVLINVSFQIYMYTKCFFWGLQTQQALQQDE